MIRRVLAAVVGGLLVSGLVSTQLVDAPAAPRPPTQTGAPPHTAARPASAAGAAPAARANATATAQAGSVPWNVAPDATLHGTKPGGGGAHPGMFEVERDRPRVDAHLRQQLAAAAPGDVLTVFVHARSAGRAAEATRAAGLAVVTTFDEVGVAVAAGAPAAIEKVTTTKGVSFVEANRELRYLMETSNEATRAAEARKGFDVTYLEPQPDKPGTSKKVCTTRRVKNRTTGRTRRVRRCRTVTTRPQPQPPIARTQHSPGVDGSGVSIAVLDTGIDGTHPMFQRRDGSSKVVRNLRLLSTPCDSLVPVPCEAQPSIDEFFVAAPGNDSDTSALGGHGTHVSGTAAGVDVMTSTGDRLHGTAPGADLVVIGMGASLWVLNPAMSFGWVLRHHADPCGDGSCPPIRVVNNSYTADAEFDPESTLAKLQRALVAEGVVVVWAAGNSGGDGTASFTNGTSNDPTPGVLSIGSYRDAENGTRTGSMSSFSSRGKKGAPLTYPDLAAPGDTITSACRPALTICRGGDVSDLNYGTTSGTSMAAPNVAGVVAQLLQANPALTPAQVEDILEDTAYAFPLGGPYEADPANPTTPTSFDKGHGLVDAATAVARARSLRADPAAPVQCKAGDASVVDAVGDAYALAVAGESATNEPHADIVETRTSWDPAGALTFATRLVDVPSQNSKVFSLVAVTFARAGDVLVARAERTIDGDTAFALTDEGGGVIARLAGSFDAATDVVSVTVPNATLAAAKRAPFASGDFLQIAGVDVFAHTLDTAGATCPYRIGTGSAVPPAGTAISSGAAASQANQPADAHLSAGNRYEWDTGPYTAVFGTCERLGLSDECYRPRVLVLDVPAGGARFDVTITPDSPLADFDVTVRGPDGATVGSSEGFPVLDDPEGVERVSVDVTVSGRYIVEVVAWTTVMASYHGVAALVAR